MKKVLLVIDMQNDFVNGSLGTKEAVRIVGAVRDKIEKNLEEAADIIFTRDSHNTDYLNTQEGKKLPVEHCIIGTRGWEIIDQLKQYANHIVDKPGFGSSRLVHSLHGKGYDEIELIGVCTDICVVTNALLLKTAMPETEISVDASCCAGVTPESHEAALTVLRMCQVTVK